MTQGRVIALLAFLSLTILLPVQAENPPNVFVLEHCWPPGHPKWTRKIELGQPDPHCQVEDVIIIAYHKRLKSLRPSQVSPYLLVNAPISGMTEKRGRHLLSFSAFNGFRRLAEWGISNGADINAGDKDNATMLGVSIANKLEYMIAYAFTNSADPNIQSGEPENRDTALSASLKWTSTLNTFAMVLANGAHIKDQAQHDAVAARLYALADKPAHTADISRIYNLIESLPNLMPPQITWMDKVARKADLIDIDLADMMDQALLKAVIDGRLATQTLNDFRIHGKTFAGFVAFNGFDATLERWLGSVTPEQAREIVLKRDLEGNDLLLAAIKGKNANAVRLALSVTTENVNTVVPRGQDYSSEGNTPMDVARKWQVPEEIIEMLETTLKKQGSP